MGSECPDDAFVQAAIEAVARAGEVCRFVQSTPGGPERITKPDGTPVTVADFAAQAVVARVLNERLGAVCLVGEESAKSLRSDAGQNNVARVLDVLGESGAWVGVDEAALMQAIDFGAVGEGQPPESFWTVDPIDGTKGFLRGKQYCVCLARIDAGVPTVAALACPNLPLELSRGFEKNDPVGSLYFAVKGKGAWVMQRRDGEARAIGQTAGSPAGPVRLAVSVSSGIAQHQLVDRLCREFLPHAEQVRLDSQCKYAVVAGGAADAYVRIPTDRSRAENIWDHAPGVLMTEEAGCIATDIRGRALRFDQPRMSRTEGIISAPPALHRKIIESLGRICPE